MRSPDLKDDRHVVRRRQTTAFLRRFGDLTKKLKVCFWHKDEGKRHNTIILNMMAKYCTGPLEKLELVCCKTLDIITDATSLFRNDKELILNDSEAIDSSVLLNAKELIRFGLDENSSRDVVKFISNDYPKLRSLSLSTPFGGPPGPPEIDIANTLKRYTNLMELELVGGVAFNLTSIGECSTLQKITLWIPEWDVETYDILPVAQLDKLTALKFSSGFDEQSILKLLKTSKSFQTLKELTLPGYSGDGKELIAVFSRFINIKLLSFNFYGDLIDNVMLTALHRRKKLQISSAGIIFIGDGLIELVQNLPHLKQLHHGGIRLRYVELKISTYLRICDIYRARNGKLLIYNFDIG